MARTRRITALGAACGLVLTAALSIAPSAPVARAATGTTAWQAGRFGVDTPDLVRRSDVVLAAPNTTQAQSMPLGNGTLGAAVWAAGGFTAQLNRSDTLPDRKSPGWLTVPGLARLTGAPDFSAHLDLYDGTLVESGGGMTATVYVRADKDELVVDVTGADPTSPQTARLALWSGRSPQPLASGSIATLGETWVDGGTPGASGATFGSLGAITAGGRDVSASVVDSRSVQVSFTPNADGTFRLVAAAPHWTGGDAQATATTLLGTDATTASRDLEAPHLAWWHDFWGGVGLVRFSSADGSADYLENLRTLDLYDAAAESRDTYPGSQAGVGDLFSAYQDTHQWDPADYWHWNLRMQVQANLSSGAFSLNDPYFRLYNDNLAGIESWTQAHMGDRPGVCVPETMRFDGNGYLVTSTGAVRPPECDATASAFYNTRTVSTGAEVGLWVWQQYLMTGDRSFLAAHYQLMAQAARFLLAYATTGTDGYLHTYPSNAHETQWDVHDPTTDLAAEQALFPATVQAAQVLGQDADLVARLQAAIPRIRPFARTDAATRSQLLSPADDAAGQDVIAPSYDPAATKMNSENIGLEPVWPYDLIGDSGALSDLAKRTYTDRPDQQADDWSLDPLQAARLGLGSEVSTTLIGLTEKYQKQPSGMATFVGDEPYVEQQGVVAAALNEALVQDYDGLLRIAPALPPGWDADGTVFIQGGSKVSVQVHGGTVTTVGINAGSTGTVNLRNPWPGQQVEVVDGGDETTVVVPATTAAQIAIPTAKGSSYLVQPVANPVSSLTVAAVTGDPALRPRTLGPVTIGLPATSTLVDAAASRCLDDPGSSTTPATRIDVRDCGGGADQRWTYTPGKELTVFGMCLDAYAGGTAPGTSVILWRCNGQSYQQWTLNPDGTVRGVPSGLCLDLTGGATGNGTPIQLATCTAGAS
ncbi:RICIN domain-containing protein [Kitasatospora sp. RB6PN24]|uniref:RICIN domain-containing protein n=1 Tax=Kitasatospora humi TaxID=2893891 RepID=UPI001E547F54|nr:RICIN domain-containing protein [Kitasatospora humi]MCC9307123.1 RICIN domain-containing protein [Kitasatospora humi]